MVNLSAFLRFHATRTPDRLALVFEGQRISYGDLHDRAMRMAAFLAAKGVGRDDVVAVFMKNSAAFLEIAFATSHLGAVFLPINFRLAADEAGYIRENAGAKLVLVDDEFPAVAQALPNAIVIDGAMREDGRVLAGRSGPVPPLSPRAPGDLMRLMYTSGTTDRPKGVMISYENFYWKNAEHVVVLGLNEGARLLVTGPLYHVGGLDLPGLTVFWLGGFIYLHREFEPAKVLASIEAEKLNCAWLAPVMLSGLLALPDRGRYDVSTLRWVIGGGERTPESRIREFTTLFTKGRYIDAYGLTETVSGDTFMEAGREIEKIGSVGRTTPHVELEIRDDAGKAVPAGTSGEICLRGPKVTKGYWKDKAKTAASFFADGFFRTGDVGHVDAEGFLYLTDRKKDIIISGGENIASSEVERVIYQMPEVMEAAVIGLADPRWGEKPVAVVALKSGAKLDLDRLQAHCRSHLAGFKVPKELRLVEALPRNPSGKILKRVLRDQFAGG
ncbi:MAG: AMP-binding protein [Alphaproteobacteria bacterium]|nr:AMP-binding protein [Alphaproteobacteria bacterium]